MGLPTPLISRTVGSMGLTTPLFCRLGLNNGAAHPVDQPHGREQWGLAPPLFCRLGLINGAAHPVDQPPGRINGVGLPRCSAAWV